MSLPSMDLSIAVCIGSNLPKAQGYFRSAMDIRNIYRILAASRDEPSFDPHMIDLVFSEFAACERTFRIALDEFHAEFGPSPKRLSELISGGLL